jgi:mRNA interferase RelE/StbE
VYFIELSIKTQKFIEKLDPNVQDRILNRLKKLETNPIPKDSKFIGRLEGDKIFRYRIGDFRALYKVKEQDKIVLIAKIDKRPRIYHR